MLPDANSATQEVFANQIHTVGGWAQVNPWLGWIAFGVVSVILVIVLLARAFSTFDIIWARLLKPIARRREFSRLTKAAKKFDIRGNVNRAIAELRPELPAGWVRDIDIEWVERETKENFFHDNEVVVRVRPYEEQARNFVTVAYQFLKKSFFPKVQKVIPEVQREAAVLYVCGRIADKRGDDTHDAFVDYVFEPAVDKKQKVVEYHHRFKELDARGLFTGPFLREVQHFAEEVRVSPLRGRMGEELNEALKHLETFSKQYQESRDKGTKIEDYLWSRTSPASKYALLLVAHPAKASSGDGVRGYTTRVEKYATEGVERIYVLGTAGERRFAEQVISAIAAGQDYQLEERFELCRDYRGEPGGIGALLIRKQD